MAGPEITFRIPRMSLTAVFVLLVAAIPLASAGPGLQVVLLIPLVLAAWVLRTATVVGPERLVVRRLLHTDRLEWSQVMRLRLSTKNWVRAVLADGTEVALPGVRLRDLARFAAASDGRIDPPEPADAQE